MRILTPYAREWLAAIAAIAFWALNLWLALVLLGGTEGVGASRLQDVPATTESAESVVVAGRPADSGSFYTQEQE